MARLTRDRLFVDGELIPHFGYIKCLGVLLRPDVERNGLLEERIDSVEMLLGKIKRLRISTHDRAKVAATIAVPKALYGVAVQDLKKTKLAQLTRLLEEAIMRRPDRRQRSRVMVLTLLFRGHKLDPLTIILYRRITIWMRTIRTSPEMLAKLTPQLVSEVGKAPAQSPGPVGLLIRAFRSLRWKWKGGSLVHVPWEHVVKKMRPEQTVTRVPVDFAIEGKKKQELLTHVAREALRRQRWMGTPCSNRQNLTGVANGCTSEGSKTRRSAGTATARRSRTTSTCGTRARRMRRFVLASQK